MSQSILKMEQIVKGDWQNERKLRMMQEELSESDSNREAQLLYGNTDKYGIYQLKDNPELNTFRFQGTESLKRLGIIKDNFDAVTPENYKLVYMGELGELQGQTQAETLEAIYTKLNVDHPADYKAHSLLVSDVVVFHEDGENSAHFVDSFDFTELPKFMLTLEGKENEIQTELAVHIADRYILMHECDEGYDYSILDEQYHLLDGGIYDNPDITIQRAMDMVIADLKEPRFSAVTEQYYRDEFLQGEEPLYYRVQTGAFRKRENADRMLYLLQEKGYPAYILQDGELYKVQVGAFLQLDNAIRMEQKLREDGYCTLIVTK